MASEARPRPHPVVGTELVRDWAPKGAPRAHVVLVHGLGEHSGRYERTGSLLAEAGFWVHGFDLIGAGGTGGARWDIDDWDRFHGQVEEHMRWASDQGTKVVLMGHSLGGNVALGYALDRSPSPDLLVLSAPALAGGAAWQRAVATVASRVTPTLTLPNKLDGSLLSRDPAVGEAYFADPLVVNASSVRLGAQLFSQMDALSDRVEELDIPTLVIHGGDDRLVPTSCTECFEDISHVTRRVYPGLRHETLNEPEGPEVVADIVSWIEARL